VDLSWQHLLVIPVSARQIWRSAFGISTPFGLGTPYPKNMPASLRYTIAYEAKLLAVDFTPAVAFRVTDTLTMAAGLDIVYSQLILGRIYPWGACPGRRRSRRGDSNEGGWLGAWRLSGGANWEFAPGHRLAFIGRLPMTINHYSGSTETVGMPTWAMRRF
jgi:hypothetical protein